MKKLNVIVICFCILLGACSNSANVRVEEVDITPPYKAYSDLEYPDSPLTALVKDAVIRNTHYVTVLNNGDDALLARLHLIRKAQRSIYIQTFIFSDDESCIFLADELLLAAKRGVKVKLIIDGLGMPKDLSLIAFLISSSDNIQVKCYNPVSSVVLPSKLALIEKMGLDFIGVNQRMHNKIFVIDNVIAITGGRNFQNDYFDRSRKRNFKDRDILIVGPEVEKMSVSFAQYWNFELSVASDHMSNIGALLKKQSYRKYLDGTVRRAVTLFADLNTIEADSNIVKKKLVDVSYDVTKVNFIADKPGKTENIGRKKISKTAFELRMFLSDCENLVVMQTPYLVAGKKMTKFFKKLARNEPDVRFLVSSNSLAAADHVHAYAFSYKNKKKYLKNFRWEIFEFKPSPEDEDAMISPLNKEHRQEDYITCIHAKTYVVDSKKVWVGSFNLSPRSVSLNTEVGLIINDEEVAKAIEDDIRKDMSEQNSWTIGRRPAVPVVSRFSRPVASLIRAVPVVDVWPFTYSGCFELKEGKAPVPYYHEEFYERYKYVGPFPKVRIGGEKETNASC